MNIDWSAPRRPPELPISVVISAHFTGAAFAGALIIGFALVLAAAMKAVLG